MVAFRARVRNWHRILMLLLGLQFLIWSLSGLYMVVFDIEFIRGNHFAKHEQIALNSLSSSSVVTFQSVASRYPAAKDITLYSVADSFRYQVNLGGDSVFLDAKLGEPLGLLTEQEALKIAFFHFSEYPVTSSNLIEDNAPSELSSRHLPVWQINYEHWSAPTLYISQKSGLVVTKRHWYWRVFDLFWIMHIVDYQDIGDITKNTVFKVVASLSILASLTGCYLLLSRFRVRRKLPEKKWKGRKV